MEKFDKKNIHIDRHAKFWWREKDSYETFGCFIINTGDDLKWVNSPDFSDEYSKPMFQRKGRTLTGVSVEKNKKLTLKLGVYAITLKNYRKFINWLDYLVIDKLSFVSPADENYYYYNCKISNLEESTKYFLGRKEDEDIYYAELIVSWEIQGENVALGRFDIWRSINNSEGYLYQRQGQDYISDLPNNLDIIIQGETDIEGTVSLEAYAILTSNAEDLTNRILLFGVSYNSLSSGYPINLTYKSELGILLEGDTLLSLKTFYSSGQKTLQDFIVNKYQLPCLFYDEESYEEDKDVFILIKTTNINLPSVEIDISSQKKTNII